MTFIQKLVLAWLSKRWSDAIQTEAQSWLFHCTVCGTSRSVWDAGGIRFKAASIGKRTLVWCTHCNQLRLMSLERKTIV